MDASTTNAAVVRMRRIIRACKCDGVSRISTLRPHACHSRSSLLHSHIGRAFDLHNGQMIAENERTLPREGFNETQPYVGNGVFGGHGGRGFRAVDDTDVGR